MKDFGAFLGTVFLLSVMSLPTLAQSAGSQQENTAPQQQQSSNSQQSNSSATRTTSSANFSAKSADADSIPPTFGAPPDLVQPLNLQPLFVSIGRAERSFKSSSYTSPGS